MEHVTTDLSPDRGLALEAWHARFVQQAGWTASLRRYLYTLVGLAEARRVLEVGCGTGVLTGDLHAFTPAQAFGLDVDLPRLRFASHSDSLTRFLCGEAGGLPFVQGAFDATCCHFLLLWLRDPLGALMEMRRVTRQGGYVLALAEPDYVARIDYPSELERLGKWQCQGLQSQGANPSLGRSLAGLMATAGLRDIEGGVLGGQWHWPQSIETQALEWTMLRADIQTMVPPDELDRLQAADETAWNRGERVLFVPTFYALGRVA